MNVERTTGQIDEYPNADGWVAEEGTLTLSEGRDDLVTYAPGQWVRVFNPETVS